MQPVRGGRPRTETWYRYDTPCRVAFGDELGSDESYERVRGLGTSNLGRSILLPGCWNCLSPERRKSSFLSCPMGGGWLEEGFIIGLRVPACGSYIQFFEGGNRVESFTVGKKGRKHANVFSLWCMSEPVQELAKDPG